MDTDEMMEIAKLVMKFGEVERATRHPDGRPETDTTHTVMLALCAVASIDFNDDGADMDPFRILMFALVHDLVEVHAGDVNTARGLTLQQRGEKEDRERVSLEKISKSLPWLGRWIRRYESQGDPEAQFIRYLDKLMPKLTHRLNGFQALRAINMDADEMAKEHAAQCAKLREQYPEMQFLHDAFAAMCEETEDEYRTTYFDPNDEPDTVARMEEAYARWADEPWSTVDGTDKRALFGALMGNWRRTLDLAKGR